MVKELEKMTKEEIFWFCYNDLVDVEKKLESKINSLKAELEQTRGELQVSLTRKMVNRTPNRKHYSL